MPARNLRLLDASEDLVISVYQMTSGLPDHERYGLSAQMQRAAVSVGSNIAEGAERSTPTDFARFLSMALGSLAELAFQLRIVTRLSYVPRSSAEDLSSRIGQVRRSVVALRRAISTTGNR